jgi:PEP-CTERM motif
MKRFLLIGGVLLACGAGIFADTLNSGATSATSTAFNPTGSFWNNVSSDTVNGSNAANVGNFLGDTGAFALNGNVTAGCSTCGVNYMAGGGQMFVNSGNTPDYVSNLNFVSQTGGVSISLLYANSAANGFAEVGIYDASSTANAANNHLVLQPGSMTNLNNDIGATYTSGTLMSGSTNLGAYSLTNGSPYANWGIYVRTCEEGSVSFAQCNADGKVVTFYMGEPSQLGSLYTPYDTAHQHFALFQAGTNPNQYYAGLEDFAFSSAFPTNPVEGYGDFNDLIFGVTTSIAESGTGSGSTVPEPGTLLLFVVGLAGIGILGRRRL